MPNNEPPPRLQNPRHNLNLFFSSTPQVHNTTNTRALRSSRCAQALLQASRRFSDPLFSPPSRQQPLPPLAAVSSGPIPPPSKFPLPHVLVSYTTLQPRSAIRFGIPPTRLEATSRAQGVRRYSSRWIPRHRSLGFFR